jgi:hypothetical protein
VTDQLYREVSHVAMHQIKHADNGSERSDALGRFKDSDRPQGTPLCCRRYSFHYMRVLKPKQAFDNTVQFLPANQREMIKTLSGLRRVEAQ